MKIFVTAVMVLAVGFTILFWGVSSRWECLGFGPPPKKAEADPYANKQRFEVHYQSIGNGPGLYRIHDKQTGKDYLAVDHCSIVEIAPTNKELPFDK